jgi:hypothetical protein
MANEIDVTKKDKEADLSWLRGTDSSDEAERDHALERLRILRSVLGDVPGARRFGRDFVISTPMVLSTTARSAATDESTRTAAGLQGADSRQQSVEPEQSTQRAPETTSAPKYYIGDVQLSGSSAGSFKNDELWGALPLVRENLSEIQEARAGGRALEGRPATDLSERTPVGPRVGPRGPATELTQDG